MDIRKIKPSETNPRKIKPEALAKLVESIRRDPEFMALRPIVVDESGVILGGNQRYRAILEMGLKEIPDVWVVAASDLTDDQRRRFILVDNAPGGMAGEWDIDLLANEWDIPELESLGFSLEALGLKSPDFQPGTIDDQGRLDELSPKMVKCPHCDEVFDSRGHEQG